MSASEAYGIVQDVGNKIQPREFPRHSRALDLQTLANNICHLDR